MSIATEAVQFDMYDRNTYVNPYLVYRRLREEAPLYYNEEYDFYAVSRFDDAERVMVDREGFISSKGIVYNIMPYIIRGEGEIPDGLFICEDAPLHTAHRGLVSRVFTPKRVGLIEPEIRAFCAKVLDGLVGSDGFDWNRDLAAQIPMRVIGMLVGIPDGDLEAIRDHFHRELNDESMNKDAVPFEALDESEGLFGSYLDWRAEHPSDDLMTQMLTMEFDDKGTTRRLSRTEILTFLNLIAGAGTDTTARLIGWIGKLLGEHPDQRTRDCRRSLTGSERSRRGLADGAAAVPFWSVRDKGCRIPRFHRSGREHHARVARLGQPRRQTLREPRDIRHPSGDHSDLELWIWPAPLPRCQSWPVLRDGSS